MPFNISPAHGHADAYAALSTEHYGSRVDQPDMHEMIRRDLGQPEPPLSVKTRSYTRPDGARVLTSFRKDTDTQARMLQGTYAGDTIQAIAPYYECDVSRREMSPGLARDVFGGQMPAPASSGAAETGNPTRLSIHDVGPRFDRPNFAETMRAIQNIPAPVGHTTSNVFHDETCLRSVSFTKLNDRDASVIWQEWDAFTRLPNTQQHENVFSREQMTPTLEKQVFGVATDHTPAELADALRFAADVIFSDDQPPPPGPAQGPGPSSQPRFLSVGSRGSELSSLSDLSDVESVSVKREASEPPALRTPTPDIKTRLRSATRKKPQKPDHDLFAPTVPQASPIPFSRRNSLEDLVTATVSDAQVRKVGRQSTGVQKRFLAGLQRLNEKPGRSQIDIDQAQEFYATFGKSKLYTGTSVKQRRQDMLRERDGRG